MAHLNETKWIRVKFSDLLEEVDLRVRDLPEGDSENLEVLSLTKSWGLIPQSARFDKRIATEDISKYKVVRPGWIVYNPYVIWEGAIHALRSTESGVVSPAYPIFKRTEDDNGFLDFILRTDNLLKAYNQLSSGAVNRRRSIKKEDFLAIEIEIPPLPEQRTIAYVLRSVQKAKDATEKVIKATIQLRASLMKHLFTYGAVPFSNADKVELKEVEEIFIPETWELSPVSEFGQIITGSTPSTKKPEHYGNSYMFISPGDMDDGIYVRKSAKHLSYEGLSVSRVLPSKSVLVVCIGSSIGKTALTIYDNCTTNQQINAVVPFKGVIPEYLYYAIKHRAEKLPDIAGRAAIPIVNKSNFAKFLIIRANERDQEEIANILLSVDSKLEKEKARSDSLNFVFKALLHQLVIGKIPVHHLNL